MKKNMLLVFSALATTAATLLSGCTAPPCLAGCAGPYQGTWQDANGQACQGPKPGCDYFADTEAPSQFNSGYTAGAKITEGDDPNFTIHTTDTTQQWNYTAPNGQAESFYGAAWQSSDGIIYDSGGNALNSVHSGVQTKDTDLQRANVQQAALESAAQHVSVQFQMNVSAARQLVTIADRVNQLVAQSQGQVTAADRTSVVNSVLTVGGISPDDVNTALANSLKGDMTSANALVDKAATNLGMPDSQALRNKLLPAYGIQVQ